MEGSTIKTIKVKQEIKALSDGSTFFSSHPTSTCSSQLLLTPLTFSEKQDYNNDNIFYRLLCQ